MDVVVRQTGVGNAHVVVLRLPGLLTHHTRHVVTVGKGVRPGDVVLNLPELAGVLLRVGRIGVLVIGGQADQRPVGVGLAPSQVEAQLRVPCQVLIELHVEEDAAIQLLTVQRVAVQQGQGNGVRARRTLVRARGVVAVHIVDRQVGRGGQRVVDDALFAIGQLQVVVRVRESHVQPHLQPRLQVGIDVRTYRQTIEFRTDNGTLLIHVRTTDIVTHLVRTTLGTDLVLVGQRRLEYGILPVGTLAQQAAVDEQRIGRSLAHAYIFIIVVGILAQVQNVETLRLTVDGKRAAVRELGVASLTMLGGNQDDTVGTLGTIDSRGRGVLQNLHRDNVLRVDGRQRRNGGNAAVTQSVAQTIGVTSQTLALDYHTINHI